MKSKRTRAVLKAKGFRRTSDALAEVCYKKTIDWHSEDFWVSTAHVLKMNRYLDKKPVGTWRKKVKNKVGTHSKHETTHYEGR
ncbi:hypothetical protein [Bacillus phage SDFMU_Pbc]|uniref:Uncharacterized protein n=1 Tax=Bacillus phage SDFMU_Pbc TaxID=3076135 RepID=A0AA96KRN5_9CAUD|nr:hypothetical protein [Bacillus phage SDFMU_Pbc]